MKRAFKALVAACLASAAGMAAAQTATTNLNVTATVPRVCTAAAGTLAFGSYDPSSGVDLDVNGSVSVRCTRTTAFTVEFSAGGTGGTFTNRVMRDAATPTPNTLNYNLFTTGARTTVLGDGTAGTGTLSGTGQGMAAANAQTVQVFGRIPNQPAAIPSTSYADTVVVTVRY